MLIPPVTDNTESSYVTFVTLVLRRIAFLRVGIRIWIRVSYVFQRKFFFPPANALIFDELENIRNAVNFVECAKYDSLSSIVACFNSGETQFLTRPENRSKASKRRIKIKISRTRKRGTQFRTITFQPSSPSCRARRVFDENCGTRPSSSRRTVSVREFYEIYGIVRHAF